MARTGRPPKIQSEDSAHLVAIVQSDRTATLDEIRQEFKRRTGIDVHEQTIVKTLGKLGIRRVASDKAVVVKLAQPTMRSAPYPFYPAGAALAPASRLIYHSDTPLGVQLGVLPAIPVKAVARFPLET